jgi:DNA-binding response OmpR family regulator
MSEQTTVRSDMGPRCGLWALQVVIRAGSYRRGSDENMMQLPVGPYRFDRFVLDPLNLRLTADGENLTLEPKAFRLLQFLIENRHRVVPKDEILTVVWEGVAVSDNALTRAIARIRKTLDDAA